MTTDEAIAYLASLQGGAGKAGSEEQPQEEKPKKKNVLHLACTATILSDEILNDDSKIRQALKAFNSRRTQGGNLIV